MALINCDSAISNSYWLRHAPWEVRLLPDESGWVKLSRLMSALDERGINFTIDDLEALNHSTDKVRWDIDRENNRIRASHGHSFRVIAGEAQQPPDTLYPALLKLGDFMIVDWRTGFIEKLSNLENIMKNYIITKT